MFPVLNGIDSPGDLRALDRELLGEVAAELRDFLITHVPRAGGHFSANLGTVELTIALHYVFDTPRDSIIWDVGHQAYAHKVLTGRREALQGIRQDGGVSGFPRRSESQHDAFGTAHAGTSISAALGMAISERLDGLNNWHIAVIGDGSFGAGMVFEALNDLGTQQDLPVLIILNDNGMSISPSVGALSHYFARLGQSGGEAQTLFEKLGVAYHGPVDGHSLDQLIPALEALKEQPGPQLLHVLTRKGKGYEPAELDPVSYHGPGRFDPEIGVSRPVHEKKSYTQVFDEWLCDIATQDASVVAVTPAMSEGSGLVRFARRFPERHFDVGIAEQHAVTFCGGLAVAGKKPVLAIYSTFLQRGYDQLIHDIALQGLPLLLAIDRAGLVGSDGATHMGAFDIAYLRCIPKLVVMCPADEAECRRMLQLGLDHPGPAAVRYPRAEAAPATFSVPEEPLQLGLARVLRRTVREDRWRVAILNFGTLLPVCLEVAESFDASVIDMRFVKPLDETCLLDIAREHDVLVTVEEGCIQGGAGSACLEFLSRHGIAPSLLSLGFGDHFIDHGERSRLLASLGLDASGMQRSIEDFLLRLEESSDRPPPYTPSSDGRYTRGLIMSSHDQQQELRLIEETLERVIDDAMDAQTPRKLREAIQHAVFPGGARIRPQLCLKIFHLCGGERQELALNAAAAIELIHCASLVHDDLPCFDNAEMRRGQPSVQRAYGEPMAVLAGDALIVMAFSTLGRFAAQAPEATARMIAILAEASGPGQGLIAGQSMEGEERIALKRYHHYKTASLFSAATQCGALAGGMRDDDWRELGEVIGQAYQIADDLADVVGQHEHMGKGTSVDERLNRPNIVHLMGRTSAEERYHQHLEQLCENVPLEQQREPFLEWINQMLSGGVAGSGKADLYSWGK